MQKLAMLLGSRKTQAEGRPGTRQQEGQDASGKCGWDPTVSVILEHVITLGTCARGLWPLKVRTMATQPRFGSSNG